jgi:hypothetical protein
MDEKCQACGSKQFRETLAGKTCERCGQVADNSPSAEVKTSVVESASYLDDDSAVDAGDFNITSSDFSAAKEAHESRAEINQKRDEERRARITTDFDKWKNDKDSFDFPGIDTPSARPEAQEKDRPFVDADLDDLL